MATPRSRGTLDRLILRTLTREPSYGPEEARHLALMLIGTFDVNSGSFLPARHRPDERRFRSSKPGGTDQQPRVKLCLIDRAARRQIDTDAANPKSVAEASGPTIKARS